MIQVDVFWSFAFGASFAALCPAGIRRTDSIFVNKYFVFTLAFLSLIFAPSGIYLLWEHTAWETMFFLDRSMHGIWPCVFAHTNVSLGVLGYVLCYKLVKAGRETEAHCLWLGSYSAMFAILTFGYDRFLYAGTQKEWQAGVKYELTDFFSCKVFHALLCMLPFVAIPLVWPMNLWPRQYGMTRHQKATLLWTVFTIYVGISILFAAGFTIPFLGGYLPHTWQYDRLAAFGIGQVVLGFLFIFLPLLLIVPKQPKKQA